MGADLVESPFRARAQVWTGSGPAFEGSGSKVGRALELTWPVGTTLNPLAYVPQDGVDAHRMMV